MAIFKGFIGQSYTMDSLPISAQRTVNWYPEIQTDDNSAPGCMQPTPGYKLLFTLTDPLLPEGSFTRGIFRTSKGFGSIPEEGGSILMVVGPYVYWVKSNNNYQRLGTISNLNSKVSITDDGFGVIIADGTNLHRLQIDDMTFTTLAQTNDMSQPTAVDFLDSFTISIGKTQDLPANSFFWSNGYDNSIWEPLDNTQAEQSQDPITGMITCGGFLLLCGPTSYELWSTTGDSKYPFARSYASSGSVGVHAPSSLCKMGNNVYMLGQSNQGSVAAYKLVGTEMQKVSTLALEQEWSRKITTDCTTWTYSERGHNFVVFNFDAADRTWVLDTDNGMWHERATRNISTDTLHRWEPNFAIQRTTFQSTQILVGDRFSTNIYELRTGITTENGNNIRRIRSTTHINDQQNMLMVSAVRFDMETGMGISDEDTLGRYTQAPTVMFKYSQNRGRTWSSEIRRTAGRTGEYGTTVEFTKLGASRNFTVEYSITDPCSSSIINGFIFTKSAATGRKDV